MNKVELSDKLSERAGLGRADAEKFINHMLDVITEQLKAGGEVTLTSFGSFSVAARAARMGVNPQNPSEKIQIPATKVIKFKAGKGLKEAIRS